MADVLEIWRQLALTETWTRMNLIVPICCWCNSSSRCRNCQCSRSGTACVDCLPSRRDCCVNKVIDCLAKTESDHDSTESTTQMAIQFAFDLEIQKLPYCQQLTTHQIRLRVQSLLFRQPPSRISLALRLDNQAHWKEMITRNPIMGHQVLTFHQPHMSYPLQKMSCDEYIKSDAISGSDFIQAGTHVHWHWTVWDCTTVSYSTWWSTHQAKQPISRSQAEWSHCQLIIISPGYLWQPRWHHHPFGCSAYPWSAYP